MLNYPWQQNSRTLWLHTTHQTTALKLLRGTNVFFYAFAAKQWKTEYKRRDEEANAVYYLLTPELKDVWISLKREAPHHGFLLSLLKNMDSTYTRESLGMHCACGIDGSQTTSLRPVPVVPSSQLIMPWYATLGGFQPFVTMRFMTLQPHFSPKFAIMLLHNLHSNLSVAKYDCSFCKHRGWSSCRHLSKWILEHVTGWVFDVRVFYPNASSNSSTDRCSVCRKHEQAKKHEYGQRIREVECGIFTPLVLSTTVGMGSEATTLSSDL